MAEFAVVRAACNTSTGTQDFTSTGFGTPKAALFFLSAGTADGTQVNNAMLSIGATDGTRSRAIAAGSEHGVASSDTGMTGSGTAAVVTLLKTSMSAIDGSADFSAWITDGVRINWTDAPPEAYMMTVVLIGGNGVSNCYVGNATAGATVGAATDVTDPAFEPTFVLTFGANDASLTTDSDLRLSLGVVVNDGSNTQRSVSMSETAGQASAVATLSFETDCVARRTSAGAGGPEIQIQDFDANGFSLYTRVSNAEVMATNYLAVKLSGLSAKLLTSASPTGTGSATITGAGFTPQFGLMLHSSALAVDTLYTDGSAEVIGISAFTSSAQGSSAMNVNDAVAPNTQSLSDNDPVSLYKDGATFMAASFSAFTSDGVTFSYGTTDGSARQRAVLFVSESATQITGAVGSAVLTGVASRMDHAMTTRTTIRGQN
jgi:hypothetical protein